MCVLFTAPVSGLAVALEKLLGSELLWPAVKPGLSTLLSHILTDCP